MIAAGSRQQPILCLPSSFQFTNTILFHFLPPPLRLVQEQRPSPPHFFFRDEGSPPPPSPLPTPPGCHPHNSSFSRKIPSTSLWTSPKWYSVFMALPSKTMSRGLPPVSRHSTWVA